MKQVACLILIAVLHLQTAQAKECPGGKFLNSTDMCEECPPGTYRQVYENRESPNVCLKCPAGTYQPFYGVAYHDLCRYCQRDTFSNELGAANCKACPEGTASGRGAKECSKCPAGWFVKAWRGGCKRCGLNQYSSMENARGCTDCPLEYKSRAGSTSVDQCRPCTHGDDCFNCGINMFSPGRSGVCFDCPEGTVSEYGSRSIKDCKPCPKNTFRRLYSYECKPCRKGSSTIGEGAAKCQTEPGESCPRKRGPLGGYRYNAIGDCVSCPAGFRWLPRKKRCGRCPKGSVRDSDRLGTKCVKCKDGKVPDRIGQFCVCPRLMELRDGKCQLCRPGHFYASDGSCTECRDGLYQDQPGQTSCKLCDDSIPKFDKTGCSKCPPGLIPNVQSRSDIQGFFDDFFTAHFDCVLPQTGCPPNWTRNNVGTRATLFSCTSPTGYEDLSY